MVVDVAVWYNQEGFVKTRKGAQPDDRMKLVYSEQWDEVFTYPRSEFANWFFEQLNINHPPTWRERSMSVGDVVQFGEDFYSCQPQGWLKMEA